MNLHQSIWFDEWYVSWYRPINSNSAYEALKGKAFTRLLQTLPSLLKSAQAGSSLFSMRLEDEAVDALSFFSYSGLSTATKTSFFLFFLTTKTVYAYVISSLYYTPYISMTTTCFPNSMDLCFSLCIDLLSMS